MDDFEHWYREQRPSVLAACVALSGDLDASRDATDEAFTRALERWASVSKMDAPGAWTQTVALNCLRRAKRRRRKAPPPRREGLLYADLGTSLPDQQLWSAVRELPFRQQTAIVLRYVHDLSYDQVAAAMGISSGAVASTLNAARTGLARLLGDRGIAKETVDD